MTRTIALLALLMLGACAVVPPAGPSVMALPAKGKDLAQFQQEDASCRQFAWNQIGGTAPADAANQSFASSLTLGTLLGGAAGAAIGAATGNPAAGAAIGAGSGLFLGGATGANAAGYSSAALQQRYDISYSQCMSASGNIAPVATGGAPAYGAPWYPAYGYGYGYGYGYPYPWYPWYWGAPVGVGASFAFIGGHGGHRHHGGGHWGGGGHRGGGGWHR